MKIIKICGRRASGKTTKAISDALNSNYKYINYICANRECVRVMIDKYKKISDRLIFITYNDIILMLRRSTTLFTFRNNCVIYETNESKEMYENQDIIFNLFRNEGISKLIITEKTDGPLEWKIIEN